MKTRLLLIFAILSLADWVGAAVVTVGPQDNAAQKYATCARADTFKLLDGAKVDHVGKVTDGIFWQTSDNGSYRITNCGIGGVVPRSHDDASALFVGGGIHDSYIGNCAFANCGNLTGIYGYPGDRNTIDNCTFDRVYEPIHFSAVCDGLKITRNTITNATRIGIELQKGMTNLLVDSNYVGPFLPHIENGANSHMALSCATGGSGTPPFPGQGNGITITNNVWCDEPPPAGSPHMPFCAMELMGQNIVSSGNLAWNWGYLYLNGTIGTGAKSSNNKSYGGEYVANDSVAWPIPPIASTNDVVYALAAMPTPPVPGGNPVPPATQPSAPTDFAASNQPAAVQLTWTATAGATYKLIRQTTGNGAVKDLGAVTTPAIDSSVTPNWEYDYQLTATVSGATSAPAKLHWQFVPPVVPPVPVPTPINVTVTTVTKMTSTDAGATFKVVSSTATTQP